MTRTPKRFGDGAQTNANGLFIQNIYLKINLKLLLKNIFMKQYSSKTRKNLQCSRIGL